MITIAHSPVILDLNKNKMSDGRTSLGESTPKKLVTRQLRNQTSKKKYEGIYRVPWDNISKKELNSMNLAFTLCPDIRVDFDCKDKSVCVPKLIDLLIELKNNNVLNKIISNYEYGEKGKEYGKLHFHGMVLLSPGDASGKLNNREKFEKALLKVFNKRSQLRDKTLHTKLLRKQEDRDRYHAYLKKEQQCKIKSLVYIN